MSTFRILFNGEYEDDVFNTESEAEEYACYLCNCSEEGASILHMNNPGDYDEDDYDCDYEIVEFDDDGEVI